MDSHDKRAITVQLVSLCHDFDTQNQALRSRIAEVMTFAEREVAARVHLSHDIAELRSIHADLAHHHQLLLAAHDDLSRHVAEVVASNDELSEHIDELREQLHLTERALAAIESSRAFRLIRPFRQLWARVRGG